MDNIKDDLYYIRKIFDDLEFIERHMASVDLEEFSANELLQDSMMFRLIQISENSRRLSDSYRESRTKIPWTAMFGLRNRIVHDYGSVDLRIVFNTLKNDVPELLQLIESD